PEGGPLTGEPDAVNPHVRFGGRGVRNKSGLSYLYFDGQCSGIHAPTGTATWWKLVRSLC
ncbi:MAG: hypothetical protein M0Z50_04370, partial [Planctomycetia bacterium]|nr:hypothetical protein [Planctomycetia bacterium]